VLRGSLWPAQKQRLLANLSQTTSLLSWLQFFDRGDRAAARGWLMRSTRAAQVSGDPELMMLAMIRGAEQQTYSGRATRAPGFSTQPSAWPPAAAAPRRCHGFWRRTPKPTRPWASWTRAWLSWTGRWTRYAPADR
jgi:hypothetical protein